MSETDVHVCARWSPGGEQIVDVEGMRRAAQQLQVGGWCMGGG